VMVVGPKGVMEGKDEIRKTNTVYITQEMH
jgi:hypothetical protein